MNACFSILQPSIWWKVRCHNEAKALIEMFVVESDPLFFSGVRWAKRQVMRLIFKKTWKSSIAQLVSKSFLSSIELEKPRFSKTNKWCTHRGSSMKRVGGGSWSASKKCHLIRCIRPKKRIGHQEHLVFHVQLPDPSKQREFRSPNDLLTLYLLCFEGIMCQNSAMSCYVRLPSLAQSYC